MEPDKIIHYTGYVTTLFSFLYLVTAIARKKWHKTSAKIRDSKVDRHVSESQYVDIGEYFSSVRTIKSVFYRPILKYAYTVDAKNYTSAKLYSVNILPIRAKDLLPIISGSTRTVYFNPQNPAQSYLFPSRLFPPFLFLLIGLVLAFADTAQFIQIWNWSVQFISKTLEP